MTLDDRRIGLEQEFFLVDEDGFISNRADEFLVLCREAAKASGRDPTGFAPECAKSMVEINMPPAYSLTELSREYTTSLELALSAGRELGLRLYPLATYPLRVEPVMRDELHYQLQARSLGQERFAHAGRCAGVHLHLEVAAGTVDPRVGVSYAAPRAAREELLNLYNLATALDPALIALTRSCPFYEGIADGMATRTAFYRGDPDLAPHGLYAWHQWVGGLLPYASSTEELVEQQFTRYHAWMEAMNRAGVERRLFLETGGGLLSASSWNPVRLNPSGTVELRGIDSNYPETVLAISALISSAAERVRLERLAVLPHEDLHVFEVAGETLLVPPFGYLNGGLFHAAMTSGFESSEVVSYLDSVVRFSSNGGEPTREKLGLEALKIAGHYRTTETEIRQGFTSPVSWISEERGLELVRGACNDLEKQVTSFRLGFKATKAARAGANGD
jgi:gamma-glutamyl:cysteine ligase YbdK (ATP-grasp superfamily)